MSILKLAKIINTNARAAQKFQTETWKRGFGCVQCGSIRAWKHRKLKNGLQKYRCEDCHHVFSDQSWTILRWNKARIDKVAVVNHLPKMTVRELAKQSELNKNTVERLMRLIRKTKGKLYQAAGPPELAGVVEMDETMMAKQWFWGAIERKTGKAIVEMIPNRTETILSAKIWKYVKEESLIITDELKSYQPHPRFFGHATVNHSKEFVRTGCRAIHTNSIESLWRQLKRRINHACNGVKLEHIQDYINEYFYTKNYDQNLKPTFFPLCCRKI